MTGYVPDRGGGGGGTALRTITKNGVSLDLNSGSYVSDNWDPQAIPRVASIFSGPGLDLPYVDFVDSSAERRIPLSCEIQGNSGQDLESKVNALIELLPLPGELATLTLQRSGGSSSVTANIIAVENLSAPYDVARDLDEADLCHLDCDLICEGYLYGASTALFSGSYGVDAVFDLSAMTGTAPAALDVQMDFGSSQRGECLAWGVYPTPATAIGTFIHTMAAQSWTGGGAAAADSKGYPAGSGNTVWSSSLASAVYCSFDTSALVAGTYAVWARVKTALGGVIGVGQTFSIAAANAVSVNEGTLCWQYVGLVSLPTQRILSGTAPLFVSMTADGSHATAVNAVALIPASFGGFCGWNGAPADSANNARVYRSTGDVLYGDGGPSLSSMLGRSPMIGNGGTLVVIGENDVAANRTPNASLAQAISYVPRWEQFPG